MQTTLSKEDAATLREVAAKEGTTVAAVLRRVVIRWAAKIRGEVSSDPPKSKNGNRG